jgi:hypothetical protein
VQLHDLLGRIRRVAKRAKDAVYARLLAILSGRDSAAKYSHLSASDRRAIAEILRDTLPDLPNDWRRLGAGQISPGET